MQFAVKKGSMSGTLPCHRKKDVNMKGQTALKKKL